MALHNQRALIDRIALQQLCKAPDLPDVDLMVGAAECLEPLPVLVYKELAPKVQKPVVKSENELTYEETLHELGGAGLSTADFMSEGMYLGDSIGEV